MQEVVELGFPPALSDSRVRTLRLYAQWPANLELFEITMSLGCWYASFFLCLSYENIFNSYT